MVLAATVGYGQEQWEKEGEGEIKDLEIEMTKERLLILPRATKYFEKIPPRPFEPIVPAIMYDVKTLSYSSPNYAPSIRPLRLKQEELSRLFGNYLSGGFGNYTSFMVEGSVATKRDKDKLLGADFFWRGFGKGPVDQANSASSTTRLTVFGKSISTAVTTEGSLNYNNSRVYFYGYAPGTDVDRDKLKQTYETFSARASIENTKKADFNYRFTGGYSYMRDAYVAEEGELSLGTKGDYKLKVNSRFLFEADLFLINRKDSLYSQNRILVHIQPAYEFVSKERLTIVAGVNLALMNDALPGASSFYVYPKLTGRYKAGDRMVLYGSLTGNLDKVNLHTLASENQWLNSNNQMTHTDRAIDIDAGVEGSMGKKLTGKLGASYATLKNLYFYRNVRDSFDPAGTSVGVDFDKFDLVYDKTTSRFNPYAEATLTHSDALSFTLRGDYYSYTTEVIAQAWHRPTYRADFRIRYNLYNKIFLQAGLIAQGGLKAFEPVTGAVVNIDPALDIGFRGRYFLSKQISAFIQLDNLLVKDYPLYLGYPSRGFQGLVGASWSF
jgi:hypothetical protein